MSVFRNTGIIIKAYEPSWASFFSPFHREVDGDLAQKASGYSHTILAEGGYDTANLSFVDKWVNASDWYRNGLGYSIYVTNEVGKECWFGIVNRIVFTQGNLTSAIGPLLDVTNDIITVYTPLYVGAVPFVRGATRFTTIEQDTDSIAKYGTYMTVFNAGEAVVEGSFNEALQAQSAYLQENAWPSDDEQALQFGPGETSITLECLGVRYWLQKYYYNNPIAGVNVISNAAGTGKLQLVLDADPNVMVRGRKIDSNPILVRSNEDQNRYAQTIISEMLTQGGASYERWTFGVYEDQTAYYRPIPTTPDYALRLGEEQMILDYKSDRIVYPWQLLPARWLVAKNAYEGDPITRVSVSTNDRRSMFIESVTYTAPYDYSLNGVKVGRLSQMIAQMGLKGIK